MHWNKNEIADVQYDFLHDALYLINLHTPGFVSCYMDKSGELALTFEGELTEDQIKGALFELNIEFLSPYSAAPIGPSAEELKYGQTHEYCYNTERTVVYSRDGIDYRRVN